MAGSVGTYAFINAKLRARISMLLGDEFYRAIASSRSFEEAISLLAETRYAGAAERYRSTGDVRLAELEIVRLQWESLGGLGRYTPEGITPFTNAVLIEFELALMKQALRLWFERTARGRSIDEKVGYLLRDLPSTSLSVDAIVNASSVDDVLAASAERPYADVIKERLARALDESSLFLVEVGLDRWYHQQLIQAAGQLSPVDREIALRLLGIQIDIRNANWVVRMKRYYELGRAALSESLLPGGRMLPVQALLAAYESDRPLEQLLASLGGRYASILSSHQTEDAHGVERLAVLEEMLRSVLFQEIHRTLGGFPFTIGTVLAYYLLVQNEVRVLISVINARYYDLPPERIEGLL
jgi:V/A-type H+-transporting ATPase subunit C